jgi:cytoskeletal protein RodZ
MKVGWIEVFLILLAGVVVALLGVWAWDTYKSWLINREYGPQNRRGSSRGRRWDD